jgi:hypothetical protein
VYGDLECCSLKIDITAETTLDLEGKAESATKSKNGRSSKVGTLKMDCKLLQDFGHLTIVHTSTAEFVEVEVNSE